MEELLVSPGGHSFPSLLPRLLPASRLIALSVDLVFVLKNAKVCFLLSNFGTFFGGISLTRLITM